MHKELTERFIRYAKKETRSDETSQTVPTTPSQTAFLKEDRKSTRLNSSHLVISYAVFCLKKKNLKKMEMDLKS